LANIYVQLTGGTSPGPYTVYADTTNSNPVEMNVSATRLRASITYDITPTPTRIILVNSNPACNNAYSVEVTVPGITPTPTPTSTPNTTPTLTPTLTPTFTPTTTLTPTPTLTATQTVTPTRTLTPTPSSAPFVPIIINLTIDAGNSGYTQIYYPLVDGGALALRQTLTSTGTTTINVPTGNTFYVITLQQTRVFDYQVSQINYRINGTPDAGSPYLQSNLGFQNILSNVPLYGGAGYPTVTFGNSYIVDTFIGNQR
jgi:hypothetical protein